MVSLGYGENVSLRFSGLRFRLFILVCLAALPLAALTLYNGFAQRHRSALNVQADALRLSRLAASYHEALIDGANQLLGALAQFPEVSTGDPAGCSNFLAQFAQRYPNYAAIVVAYPDGDAFCNSLSAVTPVNLSDRLYFQRALQTRAFTVGDYTVGRLSGVTVLPFAYPILAEGGQVERILVASLDLGWLNQLGSRLNLPPEATLLIVDHQGLVLARHPDPEEWVGQYLPEAPIVAAILAERGEGAIEAAGLDGVQRLYAFTPLPGAPGRSAFFATGIPTEVAYAEANYTLFRNLTGLAIVTVLALAAVLFGANAFILHPVNALVATTRRLARGDLAARSGLPHTLGEFNQLAGAFDQMAQTLEKREAQIIQAEARYRTLVEQIPAITYISALDDFNTIVYVSPQVKTTLGYSPKEWQEKPGLWARQLHPADRERVIAELDQARASGQAFSAEYRLQSRDGRWLWIRDEAILLREKDGQTQYLQGLMVDITELKQSELAVKTYTQQLERSNRELQDFAYIASHDLQEPLRKIQAFGERLAVKFQDQLQGEGSDYIERMSNSAARMQALINDLLTYSRVTTQAKPFTLVDLKQVAIQVIADLEERLQETGGKIELADLPVIDAEPLQMRQLFLNLLGNALKFHHPGTPPLVKVDCRLVELPSGRSRLLRPSTGSPEPVRSFLTAYGTVIQITITDNGIGFDEKYLDRIFLPFQRLHSRVEYEGSGIGLAICRKIVDRHNGSLVAASAPGQGSTFTITLPVHQPEEG